MSRGIVPPRRIWPLHRYLAPLIGDQHNAVAPVIGGRIGTALVGDAEAEGSGDNVAWVQNVYIIDIQSDPVGSSLPLGVAVGAGVAVTSGMVFTRYFAIT